MFWRCLPWFLVLVLSLDRAGLMNLPSLGGSAFDGGSAPLEPGPPQAGLQGPGRLRSLASAGEEEGAHDAHAGHASHPHEAMHFLLFSFVVGAAVSQVATHPKFRGMQQTVALFVLGMLYTFVLGLFKGENISKTSHGMWMGIDPHLLLYTLLPALLTGDAMTIDTNVVRRVAYPCLYLAGPGVLIGTISTAGFCALYFYSNEWPFMLWLTLGSILAATDPVAVVGLLKELGASPTLTVTIQGESLLNDGTAIVLFLISYGSLSGELYDVPGILIFMVKKVALAVIVGFCIGWFFLYWIRGVSNRFDHSAPIIQICLTLCSAYSSFFIAEGIFGNSGVLSCVSAALVLADNMWPAIVHRETMEHVWHMFEYLGNTLIFFLAGALTGEAMKSVDWTYYFHLLVLYVICVVIRGSIIFASRPLLKVLSTDKRPVSTADALVMTWGGLRGAVGLALAIQVSAERAGGKIDEDPARAVLFYTGGVAALTLVVNATTSPWLVQGLGLTKTPATRKVLLLDVHKQLQDALAKSEHYTPDIQRMLDGVLKDIEGDIRSSAEASTSPGPGSESCASKSSKGSTSRLLRKFSENRMPVLASELLAALSEAKQGVEDIPAGQLEILGPMPKDPLEDVEEELCTVVGNEALDTNMLRAVHEVFMSMVRSQYWEQIEAGYFVLGTSESDVLLNSAVYGLDGAGSSLHDLKFVADRMHVGQEEEKEEGPQVAFDFETLVRMSWKANVGNCCTELKKHTSQGLGHTAAALVEAPVFVALITACIVVNSTLILVEDALYSDEKERNVAFLVCEITFASIFLLEVLLKLCVHKVAYFKTSWNIFDLLLVLLSGVSIAAEFSVMSDDLPNAGILRVNHALRVMRMLRLVRLMRYVHMAYGIIRRKPVSLRLAEHVEQITVLTAFVRAHLRSQEELLSYFGVQAVDGKRRTEVAHCLLESRTEVCRALRMAVGAAKSVDRNVLKGTVVLQESARAAEDLVAFVMRAHHAGAINAKEADSIIHPILDHEERVQQLFKDETFGIYRREVADVGDGASNLPEGFHSGNLGSDIVAV